MVEYKTDDGPFRSDPDNTITITPSALTGDVTLTASTEVFQALLAGELSAASAYMSGKLALDGPFALAMKLGQALR